MKLIAMQPGREWKDATFVPLIFDNGKVADVMVRTAELAERTAEFIKLIGQESAEWVLEDNGEYKGQKKYKVTGYPGKKGGAGGGKFGGGGGGWKPRDPEHLKFEQRCMNRRTGIMQAVELSKMFPPAEGADPEKYLETVLKIARKIDLYCEVTLTVVAAPETKQPDNLTTPKGATSETPAGQNTLEFGRAEPFTGKIQKVEKKTGQTGRPYFIVSVEGKGSFLTWSETDAAKASALTGKFGAISWRINQKNSAWKDLLGVEPLADVNPETGEIPEDDIPF